MKFLIWLVLGAVVVLWLLHQKKLKAAARQAQADHAARQAQTAHTDPAAAAQADATERMLPCATCGVHLPRSEAVLSPDGKLAWCCEAHRRQSQQASAH